jgi:predicted lipoprotein
MGFSGVITNRTAMNRHLKKLQFFFLALLASVTVLGLVGCDEEGNVVDPGEDFDRAAMLQSVADGLIIPNFTRLQSSVNTLSTAAERFAQTTTQENLLAVRTAWEQAVRDHQHCSAFGFGPGELLLGPYAQVLGAFPANEAKIEENLVNPNFNLPNSFDTDVRGFYAVEYLIYGDDIAEADLLDGFDQNRKDYLLLLVGELVSTFNGIVEEWNTSYRQEFTENDGTSAGSPVSLYYNAFVKDYENLKNFKLELPAGLTAGQQGPDGSLVEALYSGISRDLVVEHFESSKNIYFGRTRDGNELIGFDAYLESVVGGPELVSSTTTAIGIIDAAIGNLPQGRLSDNVGAPEVVTLRNELQNNTANFKASMSSLLGISITFNSGDGD